MLCSFLALVSCTSLRALVLCFVFFLGLAHIPLSSESYTPAFWTISAAPRRSIDLLIRGSLMPGNITSVAITGKHTFAEFFPFFFSVCLRCVWIAYGALRKTHVLDLSGQVCALDQSARACLTLGGLEESGLYRRSRLDTGISGQSRAQRAQAVEMLSKAEQDATIGGLQTTILSKYTLRAFHT